MVGFQNQLQFGLERKKNSRTHITNQIQIGLENFDDHCQRPENSNQIQFGSDKSLTIANVLNLEPIPVLSYKISF